MLAKESKTQGSGASKGKKIAAILSLTIVALMGAALFFDSDKDLSNTQVLSQAKREPMPTVLDKDKGGAPVFQVGEHAKEKRKTAQMIKKETGQVPAGAAEESHDAAPVDHPKDINEIKKRIYDLDIEYVEDMVLLDEVVQTGDADTKPFWSGEWISVDDFKGEDNGFNLKPQQDGTFIFYPDEETARTYTFFESPKTYTYDEERREFYWEEDYYGKTITHKAKFINDNVLAMMLISGHKVTLDIYQKTPEQYE